MAEILRQLWSVASNPKWSPAIAIVVWLVDLIATSAIVRFVPYTEIDWVAYMEQIKIILAGQTDYSKIEGGTGPLVYPGGHVAIFTVLHRVTGGGLDVHFAQYIFAGLYLATLAIVLTIYVKARIPPYVLPFLVLSKRLHSIYVLRLFNDTFVTFFATLAILAIQSAVPSANEQVEEPEETEVDTESDTGLGDWTSTSTSTARSAQSKPAKRQGKQGRAGQRKGKQSRNGAKNETIESDGQDLADASDTTDAAGAAGAASSPTGAVQFLLLSLSSLLLSIAVSVKMSALLYLPGAAIVYVQILGSVWDCLFGLIIPFATPQVLLSLPFSLDYPQSYFSRAFEFSRQFLYKWTVNWRFLSEDTFLSPEFAAALLFGHQMLLSALTIRWLHPTQRLEKTLSQIVMSRLTRQNVTPRRVVTIIALANAIGVLCARSLHYQFYSWFYWSVPLLAFTAQIHPVAKPLLWLAQEWAWNVYPSTPVSSAVVVAALAVLVLGNI